MTTAEYADKIVGLIQKRPPAMNSERLLYEVYVKLKVAEGLRTVQRGEVYSHEQVREDMWKIIRSKSSGPGRQNGTSRKSSRKSRKPRR